MSQFDAVMAELAELRKENAWLMGAVRYMLQSQLPEGVQPDEDDEGDLFDDDDWEPESPVGEYVVPIHAPKQPKRPPCPHNRQGLDDAGNLVCQRCGFSFTSTGSVQNRVGPNGGIVRDPNPPRWATQQSRGASSKNPGTPLVPYHD